MQFIFIRQVLKALEPPVCPRPATRIASHAFGFVSHRAVEMEWIAPCPEAKMWQLHHRCIANTSGNIKP